jgi:hypothetical protein
MRSVTAAFAVSMVCVAVLFPIASVRSQEDMLRSHIRADLMQDSRTAELSTAEIDALVEALAREAEAGGIAADYLDSAAETFDYTSLFSTQDSSAFSWISLPLMIALPLLLLLLFFMVKYGARREGVSSDVEAA